MKPRARIPIEQRFWRFVQKSDDGCWEWTGALSHGYGQIFTERGRRAASASRLSYELHNGPIPEGLFVCHHCDNRRCVRPDHLFVGTNSDNQLDAYRKGIQYRPRLTHCQRGHAFTDDNTKVSAKGDRSCKACNRLREVAKRLARRVSAA